MESICKYMSGCFPREQIRKSVWVSRLVALSPSPPEWIQFSSGSVWFGFGLRLRCAGSGSWRIGNPCWKLVLGLGSLAVGIHSYYHLVGVYHSFRALFKYCFISCSKSIWKWSRLFVSCFVVCIRSESPGFPLVLVSLHFIPLHFHTFQHHKRSTILNATNANVLRMRMLLF